MNSKLDLKMYLAEFIGTFALVFCGTGAIIINQESGGSLGLVGISFAFGIIVIAMIYIFWKHFRITHKSIGYNCFIVRKGYFKKRRFLLYNRSNSRSNSSKYIFKKYVS